MRQEHPAPSSLSKLEGGRRYLAIDVLRGLIMVLMALDHASLFLSGVHQTEIWSRPLPRYDDALPFLTRLVTHACAPGFFFLMGASMTLFARARETAGWSGSRITFNLALRGALLVALQFLLENPAWGGPRLLPYFGVLYCLGAAMITWAPLVRLPAPVLALASLGGMTAAWLLMPGPEHVEASYPLLARLALVPGITDGWFVLYPVLPWLGVAGLGLSFGRVLIQDGEGNGRRARRLLLAAGLVCLALFLALRGLGMQGLGGGGDFHPPAGHGWMALLNVTKYPPSPAFLLLTLGVDFTAMALLMAMGEGLSQRAGPLAVFGRAPLLFYLAHLYLYRLMGFALPGHLALPAMYPFWLLGVALLYPVCKWYDGFKRGKPPESVWRLF